MTDLQHIWQDDERKKDLSEEQLLAYLEGRLTGDELHEVESLLASESPESDAMEGLQALPPAEARDMTSAINRQLQHSLKKKRRKRRDLPDQKWSWLAILIILGLAVACYVVIHLLKKG